MDVFKTIRVCACGYCRVGTRDVAKIGTVERIDPVR